MSEVSESSALAVIINGVAESTISYVDKGSESQVGDLFTRVVLYQPNPFDMYNLFVPVTYACWPTTKLVTGKESSVEKDVNAIPWTAAESIPVVSVDYFKKNIPDYTFLFAWNHKKEIFLKEKKILKKTKWFAHVII